MNLIGQIPAYIIYTKRVQMMQANFELVLTENGTDAKASEFQHDSSISGHVYINRYIGLHI